MSVAPTLIGEIGPAPPGGGDDVHGGDRMTIVARHILIFGRVQGVGFRAFVERLALQRDIEGWVRNRRDGSVEAFFTGSPDDVAWIVDLCGRGPRASSVTQVDDLVPDSTQLGMRRPGERFSMLATV